LAYRQVYRDNLPIYRIVKNAECRPMNCGTVEFRPLKR